MEGISENDVPTPATPPFPSKSFIPSTPSTPSPTSRKLDREQMENRNIILEGSIRSELSTPKTKSVKSYKSPQLDTTDDRAKVERFHDSDNRERAIAKPLMKSLESDSS